MDERRAYIEDLKTQIRAVRAEKTELSSAAEQLRTDVAAAIAGEARLLEGRWEYFVEDDIDLARLDQLGAAGWELVSAVSYTTGFGLGGNTSMTAHIRHIFKKPILQTYSPELSALVEREQAVDRAIGDAEQRLEDLGMALRDA